MGTVASYNIVACIDAATSFGIFFLKGSSRELEKDCYMCNLRYLHWLEREVAV